jgi:hypothetical protein
LKGFVVGVSLAVVVPVAILAVETVAVVEMVAEAATDRLWVRTPCQVGSDWIWTGSQPDATRARRIASRQVGRGIRLGIFNRAYDYARRTRMTNLFEIRVKELWDLPVAEARRRLGIPEGSAAAEFTGTLCWFRE